MGGKLSSNCWFCAPFPGATHILPLFLLGLRMVVSSWWWDAVVCHQYLGSFTWRNMFMWFFFSFFSLGFTWDYFSLLADTLFHLCSFFIGLQLHVMTEFTILWCPLQNSLLPLNPILFGSTYFFNWPLVSFLYLWGFSAKSLPYLFSLHASAPHPVSTFLKTPPMVSGVYFYTLHHYIRAVNISLYRK